MAKTEDLVEQLGSMSVLDLVALKEALEEKWGVSAAAAAPMMMAAPAGGGGGGDAEVEKSDFDVC